MRRATVIAVVALGMTGCGTVLHGTHEDLAIKTRPDKAQVWVDGVQQGQAPTKVSLDVNSSHVIVIRAPGYKEQTIRTDHLLSAGYLVADLLLAIVPVIIDAATGGWYTIAPSPMNVMLQPEGPPAATTTAAAGAPPSAVTAGGKP